MAFWTIKHENGQVTLGYVAGIGQDEQPCGHGPEVLLPDLRAWVFDQAVPFDIIQDPSGVFVRQTAKNRGAYVSA